MGNQKKRGGQNGGASAMEYFPRGVSTSSERGGKGGEGGEETGRGYT